MNYLIGSGPAGVACARSLLGLADKPGTNTLRHSSAVERARALPAAGFEVRGSDPSLPPFPADLGFIQFNVAVADAVENADVVVDGTEYGRLDWPKLVAKLQRPLMFEATRFIEKSVAGLPQIPYISVGSPS